MKTLAAARSPRDPEPLESLRWRPRPDKSAGEAFAALCALIARLRAPGGCPWDREQTHESLKPNTIEEAYEVVEAIDGSDDELSAELGDLLLQVVYHAQIAAEGGRFTAADVARKVTDKMVRRHPHVFGDVAASSPGEVLRNWEAQKVEERAAAGKSSDDSLLAGVSTAQPARDGGVPDDDQGGPGGLRLEIGRRCPAQDRRGARAN